MMMTTIDHNTLTPNREKLRKKLQLEPASDLAVVSVIKNLKVEVALRETMLRPERSENIPGLKS